MNFIKNNRIFVSLLLIILFLVFLYFLVFNAALKQNENHLAIASALPRVIFGSGITQVDANDTYLALNTNYFIEIMKTKGFIPEDRLGSAFIFTKNNKRYISFSRMYSSHFILFTYPKEY